MIKRLLILFIILAIPFGVANAVEYDGDWDDDMNWDNGDELTEDSLNEFGGTIVEHVKAMETSSATWNADIAALKVSTGAIQVEVDALEVSTGAIQVEVDALEVSTGTIKTLLDAVVVSTGTFVKKAGDTMTGLLTISSSCHISGNLKLSGAVDLPVDSIDPTDIGAGSLDGDVIVSSVAKGAITPEIMTGIEVDTIKADTVGSTELEDDLDISTITASLSFRIYTNGDKEGGLDFDSYDRGGNTATVVRSLGDDYVGIAGNSGGNISGFNLLDPDDLTSILGSIYADKISNDITINAKDIIKCSDSVEITGSLDVSVDFTAIDSTVTTLTADFIWGDISHTTGGSAGGTAASDSIGWRFPNSAYDDMIGYRKVIDTFTITDTGGGFCIEIDYTSDGVDSVGADEYDILCDSNTGTFYTIMSATNTLHIIDDDNVKASASDLVQVEYPNGTVFKFYCVNQEGGTAGGSPILVDIHGQWKENE